MKEFFKKLIQSDSQESSKRFLALYIVCFLGLIITGFALYKTPEQSIFLLATWLGFAAALLGLSSYESNKKKEAEKEVEIEKVKSNSDSENI